MCSVFFISWCSVILFVFLRFVCCFCRVIRFGFLMVSLNVFFIVMICCDCVYEVSKVLSIVVLFVCVVFDMIIVCFVFIVLFSCCVVLEFSMFCCVRMLREW